MVASCGWGIIYRLTIGSPVRNSGREWIIFLSIRRHLFLKGKKHQGDYEKNEEGSGDDNINFFHRCFTLVNKNLFEQNSTAWM
ncbi:hypothetical protein COT02_02390 [Candidatus Roizmanbacteria bacterium CG07_land_8_20_14_0_80_34_15]|uniref:Uncharacterized protein n=1 Tax=Candidatus Roizmanbacteria bacterium CG07_land_8_20_14_0_80_34_15 TaxID=1974849 RepID=A0A2M6YUF9_9BACT|nr:MAG: hypothetical protein COT02_02390 [Candidatus Roizmanbacteria bacterium CG07_land_8_20_14_0_80_34_15]